MTEPNHYTILGVDTNADTSQIRQAYRRGARHAHPDAGGDPERFHALQTAYETLTNPTSRAEYDHHHGINRPRWRRPGRHAKKPHVKAWRVTTTPKTSTTHITQPATTDHTPHDLTPQPWFGGINPHHRLRTTPHITTHVLACTISVGAWLVTAWLLATQLLTTTTNPALHALLIPYLLINTTILTTHTLKTPRHGKPIPETITTLAALFLIWATNLHPITTLLAVHIIVTVITPHTIHRLRAALDLRTSTRATLHTFNAFRPTGTRPNTDRRTGAVLRNLLEHLPAARLFVHVPIFDHHSPYTIVCGRKVAIIHTAHPNSPHHRLPETLHHTNQLLTGTHIRAYVIWPHQPATSDHHPDIHHTSVNDAPEHIGQWLADEPYTLHLPTLKRLRDQLNQPNTVHA